MAALRSSTRYGGHGRRRVAATATDVPVASDSDADITTENLKSVARDAGCATIAAVGGSSATADAAKDGDGGDDDGVAATGAAIARKAAAAARSSAVATSHNKVGSDDEMSVDAESPAEDPGMMRSFLPFSFGKNKEVSKPKLGPEVHDKNQRKDRGGGIVRSAPDGAVTAADARRGRGTVQFGPRLVEAAAAAGSDVRAARAAASAAAAAALEAEARREDMNSDARRGTGLIEEEDEIPLPGKESEALPVSHEVNIPAHEKGVTALSFDPKCARMVTGAMDGVVKLFEFHGMSEAKRCFRSLEPVEGHLVQAASFTCTGGVFLAICSDSHARIYDRDGSATPIQMTVKGDMYVRDCQHTQGHTQMLTDGVCHPFQPEHWLTSSLDGTMRLWDLHAKPVGMDQHLPSIHVLKTVDKRNVCVGGGAGRGGGLHPCCVAFSPHDAKQIVGGCSDGSVQLFFEKARYLRADRILRTAHSAAVTSLAFVQEGAASNLLVTRSLDNTMKIWDCRMMSDAKGPVKVFADLPADFEKTGVCTSSDGKYIVTGTSFQKGVAMGKASLRVYDAKTLALVRSLDFGARSVLRIAWPECINQIVVGTSTGEVAMLYSPFSSTKGALHFIGKKAKTQNSEEFQGSAGPVPIFNMTDKDDIHRFYTTGHGSMTKIRRNEARHAQKALCPTRPSSIATEDKGGAFVAAVLKSGAKRLTVEKDSQKALLAYADAADKASKGRDNYIDRAYAASQPVKLLDYTVEQSEGDRRMQETRSGDFCRKCGQKICRCTDYSIYGQSKKKAPPRDAPQADATAKRSRTD
eukprot:TRINITY_DN30890_c0_g1_i1.p1 TRINITY_DN30890_c0_g1~~TRINITY_DN30890_c0_g1_i1.p1  ORF type:complete len:841 (-),score=166.50 TRINITY_DN30890_c0_g1_i1:155-2575(-)